LTKELLGVSSNQQSSKTNPDKAILLVRGETESDGSLEKIAELPKD
jgi:hypothetical protein